MIQGLTVELGQKSYPIHFVQSAAEELQKALKEFAQDGRSSALLTDEGVARAQGTFLAQNFNGVPRPRKIATAGKTLHVDMNPWEIVTLAVES